MNNVKTAVLMIAMTGLLVWVGDMAGGRAGMLLALALATVLNFVTYWYSDKIVLAMYRARPVTEAQAPSLHRAVSDLSARAGLPLPALYVIPSPSPNAFATGRNPQHAAVAVTEGLMRMLSEEELRGVLAHELSHVGNRDLLIGTIAATMAGALMILARIAMYAGLFFGGGRDRGGGGLGLLVMAIIAPLAALLLQMAISRSREYQADADAARLTGDPLALARALGKLQQGKDYAPLQAEPATAHLFIVNPLRGGGLLSLFSTHPPIANRIERLQRLSGGR